MRTDRQKPLAGGVGSASWLERGHDGARTGCWNGSCEVGGEVGARGRLARVLLRDRASFGLAQPDTRSREVCPFTAVCRNVAHMYAGGATVRSAASPVRRIFCA